MPMPTSPERGPSVRSDSPTAVPSYHPLIDLLKEKAGLGNGWSACPIPVVVDGVGGMMSVRFNRVEFSVDFWLKDGNTKFLPFMDPSELPEKLEELFQLRIGFGQFLSEESFKESVLLRNAVYAVKNLELEKCYVCYNDTYMHKTPCKHDICVQCYIKSHDTFTCGICRKKN